MPLAIDVDGTLLRSDITQEMFWIGMMRRPWAIPKILYLMATDRPALKAYQMPKMVDHFDPEHLPYNPIVTRIAKAHHDSGTEVILCSGSEAEPIRRIADHLDFIDAGFGTGDGVNLVMGKKAEFLNARYPNGFIYIGNSTQDFKVWEAAQVALAIEPPAGTEAIRDAQGHPVIILEPRESHWRDRLSLLRLPLWPFYLTALLFIGFGLSRFTRYQSHDADAGFGPVMAFFVLALWVGGLLAFRDLWRVKAHRAHPNLRYGPIASGAISTTDAFVMGAVWMILGGALIFALAPFYKIVTLIALGVILVGRFIAGLKRRLIG